MKIVHKKAFTLVGYRVQCEGEKYIEEIPKASKELKKYSDHIYHKEHSREIGAYVVDTELESEDGYWIGYEVSKGEVPEGMTLLEIPAQTYAVSFFEGENLRIRHAYGKLHEELKAKGFVRKKDAWHLEMYEEGSTPEHVKVDLYETIETPPGL